MTDNLEQRVTDLEAINAESRVTRLESIVLAQPDSTQYSPTEVAAITEERDNLKDSTGVSPKMYRDWQMMVDRQMANGDTEEEANANLVRFFQEIASGVRDASGALVST